MTIDEKQDAILALLAELIDMMPKPVATDREMNGDHGDPTMKFETKSTVGVKGKRFSELTEKQLEALAHTFDFFAKKNSVEKPDDAKWDREKAKLARGWAKRKREGWQPKAGSSAALFGGDTRKQANQNAVDLFGPSKAKDDDVPF